MVILFDSTVPGNPLSNNAFGHGILRSLPWDAVPCTLADLQAAAETFGPISDERDREMFADPEFAVEPVDEVSLSELGRRLAEQEQYDPTDLEGWDAAPGDDPDELANQYEVQELAELGISPTNRGFAGFGHDA